MQTLGELVRGERLRLKLKQQVLADRAQISQNYLSKIERDKTSRPDRSVLQRLATALGLSYEMVTRAAMGSSPAGDEFSPDFLEVSAAILPELTPDHRE